MSVFRIRFRYLYAGTEKAADEAGQVAREALTLDGRVAESSLLEHWDPDSQKWRDSRVETPDDNQPAQRSGGAKLLDGVLQIMSETPPFSGARVTSILGGCSTRSSRPKR